MAAILLIPEVCAILATDFGDISFPKNLESYFSVLDMLARHCMCVSTHRGLEHWPNIYCGVAVFLLLPMYALNEKISARKRFGNLALAGILLLGFSTNMLDFIWHGLNYPDSLPARQAFIYIFLILVMCYEAYRHIGELSPKQVIQGYLAAVLFLLFCEKFVESDDFAVWIEFLTLAFVTAYAVILYLYRTREGSKCRLLLGIVTLIVVIAESSINMESTSLGTVSRSGYLGQQADYSALYEYTKERGDGFYRLEKFTRKTKNDGTLTGYPTASVFSSTLNSSVMDMYKRLGMRHSKVYYGFDGATSFSAALLNVKYMFGESEKYESPLYTLLEQSGDIYLYESNYTLPFGYVAPTGYDLQENSSNGINVQNQLMKDLGIARKLLVKVEDKAVGDDVRFTAKEAGTYYAKITAAGTSKVEAIGGPLETQKFNDLKNESILYLGWVEEGETITLTNANEEDTTPKISADVYKMNEDVLKEALDILAAQHLEEVVYDTTQVSGKLKLTEPGRLILSIPYEKGWTVLLNGKEVEPQLFGGALMAFDLEEGEYELRMHYVPQGKQAGILVTIVSILIFVGILLINRHKHPRVQKTSSPQNNIS